MDDIARGIRGVRTRVQLAFAHLTELSIRTGGEMMHEDAENISGKELREQLDDIAYTLELAQRDIVELIEDIE